MGWFRRKVSRSCQPGGGVGLSLTGCQPDSNWIDLRCGDSCNESESTHGIGREQSQQTGAPAYQTGARPCRGGADEPQRNRRFFRLEFLTDGLADEIGGQNIQYALRRPATRGGPSALQPGAAARERDAEIDCSMLDHGCIFSMCNQSEICVQVADIARSVYLLSPSRTTP